MVRFHVVFRNAGGRGIAYFGMGNNNATKRVKSAIQRLTSRIARKMGLPCSLQEDPNDELRNPANVA